MTMTPIQAAVKRAWAKGFGPGLSDPPFNEDDAKDIILAFLDAAAGDDDTRITVECAMSGLHWSDRAKAAITALKEAVLPSSP